jgi:hypothetical protein
LDVLDPPVEPALPPDAAPELPLVDLSRVVLLPEVPAPLDPEPVPPEVAPELVPEPAVPLLPPLP